MRPLLRVADAAVFLLGWIATYTIARLDGPLGWVAGLPMVLWMHVHLKLYDWSDRLDKRIVSLAVPRRGATRDADELVPPELSPTEWRAAELIGVWVARLPLSGDAVHMAAGLIVDLRDHGLYFERRGVQR